MYGKYWYRSGINNTMRMALWDIVDSIEKIQDLHNGDIWVDIACNDGTLLSYIPKEIVRIGIDPADDTYRFESVQHADRIIQEFFSKEIFEAKLPGKKAKVITSIAMFYDVPDPKQFIKDVYDILEDDGLWVMQLSYSPLMIQQMAFDNICHEHIYYYSLIDLRRMLQSVGFNIIDCDLNNVNGGSMRLYIKKSHGKLPALSEIGNYKVAALCAIEQGLQMDNPDTWRKWFGQIEKLKATTVEFITSVVLSGGSVWGYGASTKGNTLLQYFGLDKDMIEAIADRNPSKHGTRAIGSNIPIKSEEAMRKAQPDYLIILPWHFIDEFTEREREYLRKGGKFIVPCPEFKIISYEDIK